MAEYSSTDSFRGATFRGVDLSGARFRECDLTGVKIAGSVVGDLRVAAFAGELGTVIVDDVDVTAFVTGELDRRYPERVQVREMRTAADYSAAWNTVEELWAETVGQAELLPETARNERVEDEWSFVETLRHLVFAVDVWIGQMISDPPTPFHRLGLPPTDYPRDRFEELGLDVNAQPSYAEVLAAHADRRGQVRAVIAATTDAGLGEIRTGVPAPVWGEESQSVGECLRVVITEHCEHRRYAIRDLALPETR